MQVFHRDPTSALGWALVTAHALNHQGRRVVIYAPPMPSLREADRLLAGGELWRRPVAALRF